MLKVVKGVIMVIKGLKARNLYNLIESIIVGGVVVNIEGENNTNNAYLWHMHLGHMSEHNMFD